MSLTAHEMRHLANTLEALAIDLETLQRRINANGNDPVACSIIGYIAVVIAHQMLGRERKSS